MARRGKRGIAVSGHDQLDAMKGPKVTMRFVAVKDIDPKLFEKNKGKYSKVPLARVAATIRLIWKRSIRKDMTKSYIQGGTPRPSKPGKPPKSRWQGHPFRNLVAYAVHSGGNSATIGHLPFKKRGRQGRRYTPMEVHEFGKTVDVPVFAPRKRAKSAKQRRAARRKFQSGALRKKKRQPIGMKTIKMPERPHAQPALMKAVKQKRLAKFWQNSVTSANVTN